MKTSEWTKSLANKLDIEGLKAKSHLGDHFFRYIGDNRYLDIIVFTSPTGGIRPKLRLYLSLYEVEKLLRPEKFQKSRVSINAYQYVLVKDIPFPEIGMEERSEQYMDETYIGNLKTAMKKFVFEEFFNSYDSVETIGQLFPGPYSYKEVAIDYSDFSLFMRPYYEIYLVCKCMAGIPGLLEELAEYEEMYNSMTAEIFMGEGKFKMYEKPFQVDVPALIARLRSLYIERN